MENKALVAKLMLQVFILHCFGYLAFTFQNIGLFVVAGLMVGVWYFLISARDTPDEGWLVAVTGIFHIGSVIAITGAVLEQNLKIPFVILLATGVVCSVMVTFNPFDKGGED